MRPNEDFESVSEEEDSEEEGEPDEPDVSTFAGMLKGRAAAERFPDTLIDVEKSVDYLARAVRNLTGLDIKSDHWRDVYDVTVDASNPNRFLLRGPPGPGGLFWRRALLVPAEMAAAALALLRVARFACVQSPLYGEGATACSLADRWDVDSATLRKELDRLADQKRKGR